LIEGPEGFGAIGVERGHMGERRVGQIAWREAPLIERAQERERVEARGVPAASADRPARAHGDVDRSCGDADEPQMIGPRPLAVEEQQP
jgi:hypothetical protein